MKFKELKEKLLTLPSELDDCLVFCGVNDSDFLRSTDFVKVKNTSDLSEDDREIKEFENNKTYIVIGENVERFNSEIIPDDLSSIKSELEYELLIICQRSMAALEVKELIIKSDGNKLTVRMYNGYPPMIIDGPDLSKGWMRHPSNKEMLLILLQTMTLLNQRKKEEIK